LRESKGWTSRFFFWKLRIQFLLCLPILLPSPSVASCSARFPANFPLVFPRFFAFVVPLPLTRWNSSLSSSMPCFLRSTEFSDGARRADFVVGLGGQWNLSPLPYFFCLCFSQSVCFLLRKTFFVVFFFCFRRGCSTSPVSLFFLSLFLFRDFSFSFLFIDTKNLITCLLVAECIFLRSQECFGLPAFLLEWRVFFPSLLFFLDGLPFFSFFPVSFPLYQAIVPAPPHFNGVCSPLTLSCYFFLFLRSRTGHTFFFRF